MSHLGVAGHRSISAETAPMSVNRVRANTRAAARSKPQPTSTPQPATTHVPAKKQGKRSQLKSKVKNAFTSVKKSLKTASAICFPKDLHSNSSAGSRDSYQAQVRVSLIGHTSTPSICLTRPTYRGSNVRLSLHQAAPSPKTRKNEIPTPNIGESSLNAENTRPGTASTVGTVDFGNQVNPTQIFRNSQMTSGTGDFEAFKNVIDGVRTKSPPAAADAQTSLPATAPSLPYLAMAPAMVLEVGTGTPRPQFPIQSTQQEVQATSSNVPSTLVIPSILASGSEQPRAKTRARPHTTVPHTNYLPYVPYNPRFNPYGAASPLPNRPVPNPTFQQKPSAEDLAAAFAEVEAAEKAAIRKRHTRLYAAVESGSLTSLIASSSLAATAATSSLTSSATTTATATTSNAASSSTNFSIKRKPIPKRPEAPKPRTPKPLPALPAPSSSRRFTYGIVPTQSDRDGLPSQQKKLSPAPKIARWRRK